jgi:hypothetical protein
MTCVMAKPKQPAGLPMTLGNMRAQSKVKQCLSALLVFTPFNLAFDRFSQHMRAILKPFQHVINASDCPDFQPQKDAF